MIQTGHRDATSRIGQTEVTGAKRERGGRRAEDADADRFATVPEHDYLAGVSEVVAAVMPPSEVRPVGSGAFREPKLVRERQVFFLRRAAPLRRALPRGSEPRDRD